MSDALLHRVRKVRISDTVVDQIVALIENGKLKGGDQLPGERELVNQLQVGRASVREALRILEAQGIVQVTHGRGTFIVGDVTSLRGAEDIKLWFEQHAEELRDITERREALERRAAYFAAARASGKQIDDMKDCLSQYADCLKENNLVHSGRNHLTIVKA